MPRSIRSNSLQKLTVCALFAALMCVLSPIAVPIGPVPVSLGLLGVLITAATLPAAQSTAAVTLFLCLGALGLPVFAGGMGGFGVLLGPTGGYALSYLLLTPTVSLLCKHQANTKFPLRTALACTCGAVLCHLCGTVQYAVLTNSAPLSAFLVASLPFLPFDLLKATLATLLSRRLKKLLKI